MSIFDNSRYIQTPLYTRGDNDTPTIKIRERFIFDLDNATPYTWKAEDTLDGVAYKFYEETEFRWAILDANTKYRTEFDIEVGDIIYIPSYEDIVEVIDV